jgi:hypothetical protein
MTNLFAVPTSYTVGNAPHGVAIADVNSDGKPDIVTANWGSSGDGNTVSILLNTGSSFAAATTCTVDSAPNGIAIADIKDFFQNSCEELKIVNS